MLLARKIMNSALQFIALLALPFVGGCRLCEGLHDTRTTDGRGLNAQVESILFELHASTNNSLEADSRAKLDALRKRAGADPVADAIKATVNSNQFLIKGNAISLAIRYMSEPEFIALVTPKEDECTTVYMALWSDHPAKAIKMLEGDPELITSREAENDETPLHAAAAHGHVEVVRWLLKHGANPNAEAYSKFLPIQLTTNGVIARLLIAAGTDLDHRDNWGNTPLQEAVHMGNTEIINAIVASGHPVDLRSALWLRDRERVKAILAKAKGIPPEDENQSDLWGDVNPLGIAAKQGDLELVQLLLQAGADPKAKTELPNLNAYSSPLCAAVWGSHTNIVKLLLEKGADPNIRIEYKRHLWNLLDGAEKVGNVEIIKILKAHGAIRFGEDLQKE
jgi:ankyrin repeat protein